MTATTSRFDEKADAASTPVDRRAATIGLSPSMREVRIRLARDNIYSALGPASHHAQAACLCLEIEDDVGLEHHMLGFIAEAQKAAEKRRELKALLASPPVATSDEVAA